MRKSTVYPESSTDEGHLEIFGDAGTFARIEQLRHHETQISQSIEFHKHKLSIIRNMKRKNDLSNSHTYRSVQKLQKVLEKSHGHCFDLRGKNIAWDEMIEWLMTHAAGSVTVSLCFVAISDPNAAFHFKMKWM